VNVLIAGVRKKLVLDESATYGCARSVAVELGHFFAGRNVGILIIEIGRGVQPIGSAVNIRGTVKCVGAGGGVHVDVSAAGRALLGVVHRGVDAKLLNGFRSGRWQSLADGEIRRSGALNDFGGGAGGAGNAGVVDHARGSHLAGAFAVEEIAGIDSVKKERVAGIALAVGPDGLIS